VLVPILVFCVWIGVYPNTFLKPMEPSVKNFIQMVEKKRAAVLDMEKARKQSSGEMAGVKLTSSPQDTDR
jgi:NADH-quinone oxidoreductase subunit M